MLKKKNRLTTKEFTEVFTKGENNFSKHFLFIKKTGNNQKKISVAISKKVEKLAINRIKSRRIVYKILQENFKDITENILAIFLITKPILHINKKDIKKEILKYLNS